jgi:Family of unknown function (DUF6446)
MSGRRLILGFLGLLVIFTAALIYAQFFAYYERDQESSSLSLGGREIAVMDLDLIDAATSPLKLRACFEADPVDFEGLPVAAEPTPLTPPPWFGCFDAGQIEADLSSGAAIARLVAEDDPEGTDTIAVVYPDGRTFLWRQLDLRFAK